MKHFYEMTAAELRAYRGPVFTARCLIRHRLSGNVHPHDFEEPTRELLEATVSSAQSDLGVMVSREDFQREEAV